MSVVSLSSEDQARCDKGADDADIVRCCNVEGATPKLALGSTDCKRRIIAINA